MSINNRIKNFDFLRGVFLVFALQQHFTYYINIWFIEYFHDGAGLKSTYGIYYPLIGKQIKADNLTMLFDFIFTPWVSQVYLTLAMFNLAKHTPDELRNLLPKKLKAYFFVIIFFILENFIVAPNFGQAISIYPIILWMMILSFTSIIYGLFGIRSVYILAFFSLMFLFGPINSISDYFQAVIQKNLHGGFEYDARIEYFLTSGLIGFIMGYCNFHSNNYKFRYWFILGIVLLILYMFYGYSYQQNAYDVLMHEHDLVKSWTGIMYVVGVQILVLNIFLFFEKKRIFIKLPVLNWIGENSILVFGMHRLLFVKMILPISIFIGVFFSRTICANFFEVYIYILITLLSVYLINKYKIYRVIFKES